MKSCCPHPLPENQLLTEAEALLWWPIFVWWFGAVWGDEFPGLLAPHVPSLHFDSTVACLWGLPRPYSFALDVMGGGGTEETGEVFYLQLEFLCLSWSFFFFAYSPFSHLLNAFPPVSKQFPIVSKETKTVSKQTPTVSKKTKIVNCK